MKKTVLSVGSIYVLNIFTAVFLLMGIVFIVYALQKLHPFRVSEETIRASHPQLQSQDVTFIHDVLEQNYNILQVRREELLLNMAVVLFVLLCTILNAIMVAKLSGNRKI